MLEQRIQSDAELVAELSKEEQELLAGGGYWGGGGHWGGGHWGGGRWGHGGHWGHGRHWGHGGRWGGWW